MKEHHVIYIPGLGDKRPHGQPQIIRLWKIFGVSTHYMPISWDDNEPFSPKLERITDKIDYLTSQGFLVSLVGISAGASAALSAYAHRPAKIRRLVFVCGKLRHPESVNPRYYRRSPAFEQSLNLSEGYFQKLKTIDKRKMLYLYAVHDATVPLSDNKPDGIISKQMLAFGHIAGIFIAIIFYARSICNFIKQP